MQVCISNVEVRQEYQMSCSIGPYLTPWRQGLSMDMKTGWEAPLTFLSLPTRHCGHMRHFTQMLKI